MTLFPLDANQPLVLKLVPHAKDIGSVELTAKRINVRYFGHRHIQSGREFSRELRRTGRGVPITREELQVATHLTPSMPLSGFESLTYQQLMVAFGSEGAPVTVGRYRFGESIAVRRAQTMIIRTDRRLGL